MKAAAFVAAALSCAAIGASGQDFVDLDFDHAKVPAQDPPPVILSWDEGAPGWRHSEGDSTGFVYLDFSHLGFSQYYELVSAPFGPAAGPYGFALRSGTLREQEPRGEFVLAFLSQTGRLAPGIRSVSLLTSSAQFGLSLDGQAISMRPVGLDPASPTYAEDLLSYRGEWTGDVSAFAGKVVDLTITDALPPTDFSPLVIDQIRFLPVPEPSAAWLLAWGLFVVAGSRVRPARSRDDPGRA